MGMLSEHYRAAREAAAVLEKDWLGILRLTGPDRQSWLQGMISNDVERLGPGQGCHAAHLTAQGRIVAQMTVLVEAESIDLVLERASVDRLRETFDRLIIMEDVQMADLSDYRAIGVIGPAGAAVLEAWLGKPLELDGLYRHRRFPNGHVVRTELGYDVWVAEAAADKALRAIAGHGAVAIDRGTWDVLRVEAGLPVYGVDIDATTTLPELGEQGISYDKGCYIGQEVVARIKYIGHVNRRFVGFVCDGEQLAETGSTVRRDGKDLGHVTTSLFSPALGRPVALGFVNRSAAAPGTAVELAGHAGAVSATVANLPLVDFFPSGS